MGQVRSFDGAKMALFFGGQLAVILRDDFDGLPFAGFWDLPGGGREGAETPFVCAQRECFEELGVHVPESAVLWEREYAGQTGTKWFFVARLPAEQVREVVFGDEGQRWTLMSGAAFTSHPKAIPYLQTRLLDYSKEKDRGAF